MTTKSTPDYVIEELPPEPREQSTIDGVNDEPHEMPYDTTVPLVKGKYQDWDEAKARMKELMRKRGLIPVLAFETDTAYVFRCITAGRLPT